MDIVDRATRSRMMAGIRSKNTAPEMRVRHFLHRRGFRYRLHDRKLPGHPDIVLPKSRVVIFVHGCFWHQHSACRYATIPEQNREKWMRKFEKNTDRDKKHVVALIESGWNVIVIWECGVRTTQYESNLEWLTNAIHQPSGYPLYWPINDITNV